MSRTVLVLGGGGALGAYQAGALLALAEHGLLPDALYGCSAGALNAAFLASDPTLGRARELVSWWADGTTTRGARAVALEPAAGVRERRDNAVGRPARRPAAAPAAG